MCALAPSYHVLLIARFIQGSGVCFIAVPGYASIHETFSHREAIKYLAIMGSITVLAPALGPLLGSVVLTKLSWRWIFGFIFLWAMLAVSLLILFMPETLPVGKRHSLNLSLILQNYRKILANYRFMALVTVFGLLFCGFITWIAAGPFIVIDHFKYTPLMFGVFQTLIFSCYIVANNLVRRLIRRTAGKKLIELGLGICFAVGILSVPLAFKFPNFLYGIILVYMIYGLGSGFAFAPLNRMTVESSDAPMGSKMAIFSTFMSGFATLASILVGVFYNGTLMSLALILAIVISGSFVLERTIKH